MSIYREQTYRKNFPTANAPAAAALLGQAVLQLRCRAYHELSGAIARQLSEIADVLDRLVGRIEHLERCELLEQTRGARP